MGETTKVFYEVAEMDKAFSPERFAVIRVDTAKAAGNGVEGRVMSFHNTRTAAQAEARSLTTTGELRGLKALAPCDCDCPLPQLQEDETKWLRN